MTQTFQFSGSIFGNYELRDVLGTGGMGTVYRARQLNLDRMVAIKLLSANLALEADYLERFNREAKTAASLEHPHIVPTYDYGSHDNLTFVVMRLLAGGTLGQRMRYTLEQQRSLPTLKDVGTLLTQIGGALDYAHGRGIVHRDLKPSNIMFDEMGIAYLVDFGIAKLLEGASASITSSNMIMGTPRYMSPEQWRGEPVTFSVDIYALGGVIYEMITGRALFEGATPFAMMSKHINDMPTPTHMLRSEASPAVTTVIEKAMAKAPEQRYKTAGEFAEAFNRSIAEKDLYATDFFKFTLPTQALRQQTIPAPQPTQLGDPILIPPAGWQTPSSPQRAALRQAPTPSGGTAQRTPSVPRRDTFNWIIGGVAVLLALLVIALLFVAAGMDAPPDLNATVTAQSANQTVTAAALAAQLPNATETPTPTACEVADVTGDGLLCASLTWDSE
jgi:serine/threonine-protein kinase